MLDALRSLYGRLGARYPRVVLFGALPLAYATGVFGVAGTALYVDMSLAEAFRLLVAAWALIWTVDVALELRLVRRRLAPVDAWLSGARDARESSAAWEAAAGLPLAYVRQPLLWALVVPALAAWDLYAAWELDVGLASAAILFVGSSLVYGYWVVVRFLAIEISLRPVVEDIARSLPDGVDLEPLRVPLRWRLLAALPAVNVITGIAVAGFSAEDTDTLSSFGLALVGSAAAAILVSSWLVALFSESVAAPVTQLREATRRVAHGDLSARVPVASTEENGELASSFNAMVAGLEERERLRDAFGAFVDPELAERVAREGTDFAGEEVDVSILFMDVRGFTSYSENASAREVVARLNDLYDQVVPVITEHGGHANKFIGDGLLAVFGAPERLEDHASRAVAAALQIAEVVRDRYGEELRVGLGVNSGPVMSGTIGGGGRLDFTVIGDAVNTASRVEAATRETGDDVLITEATHSLLDRDGRDWEKRPAIPMKGKSEEVKLFAPASAT